MCTLCYLRSRKDWPPPSPPHDECIFAIVTFIPSNTGTSVQTTCKTYTNHTHHTHHRHERAEKEREELHATVTSVMSLTNVAFFGLAGASLKLVGCGLFVCSFCCRAHGMAVCLCVMLCVPLACHVCLYPCSCHHCQSAQARSLPYHQHMWFADAVQSSHTVTEHTVDPDAWCP